MKVDEKHKPTFFTAVDSVSVKRGDGESGNNLRISVGAGSNRGVVAQVFIPLYCQREAIAVLLHELATDLLTQIPRKAGSQMRTRPSQRAKIEAIHKEREKILKELTG